MCRVIVMASGRFWDEPIETGPIPECESVFDCIVVGGGPGGAAAASYLAMEGRKVLLIEKGCMCATKFVAMRLAGNP